ncbi:MAG: hypothetical protein ACFB2W_00900 [Leptolyngbyaceae cyanobacterium]
MATKETLIAELTQLLREHLPDYRATAPTQGTGGLPLDIAYVRVEPWLYGFGHMTADGAWRLCTELALQYDRVPVLAYQEGGSWLFRVPLYMLDVRLEGYPERWNDFSRTASLFVDEFADALGDYQSLRAERGDHVDSINTVLGEG